MKERSDLNISATFINSAKVDKIGDTIEMLCAQIKENHPEVKRILIEAKAE